MLGERYDEIIVEAASIFDQKMDDYGPTWMFFRMASLADQLWIKIKRIRVLEQNGDESKIPEGRDAEFIGIINYAIIALIRLLHSDKLPDIDDIMDTPDKLYKLDKGKVIELYNLVASDAKTLMERKNHDYGDAWKSMHPFSITDQIIIKIFRIKNILKIDGALKASEDIDAQLFDIINYAVFALIKMDM